MDRPKDIALAIRVSHSAEANQPSPKGISDTDVDIEELFEEVGLEFIDEDAPPQDDDERRESLAQLLGECTDFQIAISPLETIRQTLMTHMWPDMVRKPLNRRDNPEFPGDSDVDDSDNDDQALNAGGPSRFPTVFNTTSAEIAQHGAEEFPGLDELKAQLQLDNLDRFDNSRGLARLEMMEDLMYGGLDEDLAGGPGPEEYARLDDWLDEDDEGDEFGFAPLDDGEEGDDLADGAGPDAQSTSEEHNVVDDRRTRQPEFQPAIDGLDGDGDDGFEDDFDDFAAFQSAPQERPRGTVGSLSLDPTPLLLHLQSVRAELAEVGDEDERRVRAGREVARVMRDLGLGDDLDDDDDDGMRGLSLALAGTPKVAP